MIYLKLILNTIADHQPSETHHHDWEGWTGPESQARRTGRALRRHGRVHEVRHRGGRRALKRGMVIDYMSSQTENVASGEEPAVRCLQECGRGKEKLMEGECWAKQINFLCSPCPESVQLELKLYVELCASQVISSIEQKTEGSEKKQQLAKEYREKVILACCFYK